MRIGLKLCFSSTAFENIDVYSFYNVLRFEPTKITIGSKIQPWSEKKFLNLFTKNVEIDRCFIQDNKRNYFSIATTGSKVPFKTLTLTQEYTNSDQLIDLTNMVEQTDGLTSAFMYNSEYEEVQSTKYSGNLEGLNIHKEILDTIKFTPASDDGFGGKEFDIRFNPGRSTLISHSWLMVGWKMWFGKDFYRLASKETILSFPYACQIMQLKNDLIIVKLYDKLEEPFTPDAMFRQWKWRECMRYEDLENEFG